MRCSHEVPHVSGAPFAEPGSAGRERKARDVRLEVVDGDIEALKAAGFTEDEIFEQTVAAAIGEGLRRLDAANEVLV